MLQLEASPHLSGSPARSAMPPLPPPHPSCLARPQVQDMGSLQGQGEFSTEMEVLSGLAHPHVVRLLGYCAQGGSRCLVYELMCAGNLEDRLGCKVGGSSSSSAAGPQSSSSSSGYCSSHLWLICGWQQRAGRMQRAGCC
jgi:hypothetical protein